MRCRYFADKICKTSSMHFPDIWIIFPRTKVLKLHFCICFKELFLKMSYWRPFQDIPRMTWKCLVFTGTFCICFKEILLKMSYRIPFEDIRQMSLIGVPENVSCKISSKHIRQNNFFKATFCTRFKNIFLKMSCPRPFQDIRSIPWKRLVFAGMFCICFKELFPKMSYPRPFQDIGWMSWDAF